MAHHPREDEKPGRPRQQPGLDEPVPVPSDWMTWGDQRIMAVGFTEGGAPYGVTEEEFRESTEEEALESEAPWARAKRALRRAFESSGIRAADLEVGWVRHIGRGLSRHVFAAHVDVLSDAGRSGSYVVLLPMRGAGPALDERARREALVLQRLGGLGLPFRVPEAVGVVPDGGRLALVRRFLEGIPLDLRTGRVAGIHPWEEVGRLAAGVHAMDSTGWADLLPGYPTRRAHGEAALAVFDGLEGPEADEALAWAREHLPPEAPSVCLHGDLLGQNILLMPGREPAVIDWEFARIGDPAYDLAIVTRGVRRPFQVEGGLARLLEAYERAGGAAVESRHVHFQELCLAAGWLRQALREAPGSGLPEERRAFLRGILRRAGV